MTDETTASGGSESIVNPLPADAPEEFVSPEAAAKYMMNLPADGADPATAEKELPDDGNAAPEKVHGEDKEADPVEEPLIERPKSWTEAEDAEWRSTPRTLQEKIVARELERDTALRRSQNEAAEKTKAIEAKVKEAEQVKHEYQGKLSEVMQTLLDQNNQQFGMIKSQADLDYLTNESIRLSNAGETAQSQQITAFLSAWQLHQSKMAGVKEQLSKAEQEKSQKQFSEWNEHVSKENTVVKELIPELAKPETSEAFYKRAVERMKELKFTTEEIADLANGKEKLSIHDHRLQQLIWSDLRHSDIQKAKVVAAPKDLPPVQRPGTARPQGAQDSENIRALEAKLQQSGSEKDAWALLEARGRASERRAS